MNSIENSKHYNYKIVIDSCCELPDELINDPRFESVSLDLSIGDYICHDDDSFDQLDFIKRVAESPEVARSACPSPDKFLDAFRTDADNVYCVTLSSKLSGSYNSACLAKGLFEEEYDYKNIHIFDSETASVGELQIVYEIIKLEEKGLPFEEIVEKVEDFRNGVHTYFVLENLDTFIKNGRISGIKALAVTHLNVKPVLAGCKGAIVQLSQGIGIRKTLSKMVEIISTEVSNTEQRILMISHCNAPERAEMVKKMILAKDKFANVIIVNMRGTSTMYANDGGIIVTA